MIISSGGKYCSAINFTYRTVIWAYRYHTASDSLHWHCTSQIPVCAIPKKKKKNKFQGIILLVQMWNSHMYFLQSCLELWQNIFHPYQQASNQQFWFTASMSPGNITNSPKAEWMYRLSLFYFCWLACHKIHCLIMWGNCVQYVLDSQIKCKILQYGITSMFHSFFIIWTPF